MPISPLSSALNLRDQTSDPKLFENRRKPSIAPFLQKRIQKTRICVHFLSGRCLHGDRCSFAHSGEELRELPNLYKTRLCTEYMKSNTGCSRGDDCRYAHGMSELRATEEVYKTALCSQWNTNGVCYSGNRCRWAHGAQELRHYKRPNATVKSRQRNDGKKTTQVPYTYIGPYIHNDVSYVPSYTQSKPLSYRQMISPTYSPFYYPLIHDQHKNVLLQYPNNLMYQNILHDDIKQGLRNITLYNGLISSGGDEKSVSD